MIVYHGPASRGWSAFGGLGQTPASVTPPDSTAESSSPKNSSQNAAKVAEILAYTLGGAFMLYALLNLLGEGPGERRSFP